MEKNIFDIITPGEYLFQRRTAIGLDRRELARKTGINETTIWKIERGGNPRWRTLRKLLLAVGTDVRPFLVSGGGE